MCVCVSHVNPLFGESVGIYWEVFVVFLFCLQEADPTVVLPFLPLIRLSTISHQSDRMWLVQYSYWQSHFTMFRDDLLVAPIKSTPVDCQNPINYPWLKSYFPIKKSPLYSGAAPRWSEVKTCMALKSKAKNGREPRSVFFFRTRTMEELHGILDKW